MKYIIKSKTFDALKYTRIDNNLKDVENFVGDRFEVTVTENVIRTQHGFIKVKKDDYIIKFSHDEFCVLESNTFKRFFKFVSP